jgi:hypothetical protein
MALMNNELVGMLKDSVEAKSEAILSRSLTQETEETNEKYQSWYPVSCRRFEPGICRTRSKEFNTHPRPSV